MASTRAHKRSRSAPHGVKFVAATALALSLCAFGARALPAMAAGAGGTSAAGSTSTAKSGGSPSAHVTSVRITSVSCVPVAQMQRQPPPGLNPRNAAAEGRRPEAGHGRRLPQSPRRPHQPHLASRAPAPDERRAARDRPQERSLGAHQDAAQPRSLHELLRADLRVQHALHPPAPKTPPTAVSVGAVGPSPFEGQGMWIWYVSQSNGGKRRLDRRPGARGRRHHAVHQEL